MKKIIACIIALSLIASLCACSSLSASQQNSANDIKITPTPTEEPEAKIDSGDLVGPWHLDSENNDLSKVADMFAGYEEWGATMEVCSDGKISWYIGAIGGSGTFSLDGDTLTAVLKQATKDVTSGPQDWTVYFKVITVDGDITLAMEHEDTKIIWNYGGATGCSGMEEGWKTDFESSLFEQYGVTPDRYEDLGDGIYQVYVVIDGNSVPYVTVDSATGDYHG